MGALGVISVLNWAYFAGLACVAAGFAIELMRTPLRSSRLILLIMILVVYVFGTASAVEPTAAVPTAWIHAGMTEYIFQHGQSLNDYAAEFSWPAGFALAAVLVAFVGHTSAIVFLHWFPLVIELLYLPPLMVIARFSGVGRRAGWLGIALCFTSNWIDQDYFSPQALNYLFYLVVIGAVMACWQPLRKVIPGRAASGLRRRLVETRAIFTRRRIAGYDVVPAWTSQRTLAVLGLLGVIVLASALSHQLTPYALCLGLGGMLLSRRLGRPELLVVTALFAIGWLSLGASNYWLGHLYLIFGTFGQVASNYGSNVSSRVTGNASHLLVVDVRILLTAIVYFLGGIGFLRRAPNSRVLEMLVGAPFVLVAVQSYGGEGLLRVVLFGLPFVSLLAASAILPNRVGGGQPLLPRLRLGRYGRPMLRTVAAVMIFGFAIATSIVRGGNDAYESFSTGELAAVNYTYAHSHPGQTIALVAPFLPVAQQDVGSVELLYAADDGGSTQAQIRNILLSSHAEWIILSQSQEAWGELVGGFPKGWEATFEASLVGTQYQVAATWPTATVLKEASVR
jgi:hypothetical protein